MTGDCPACDGPLVRPEEGWIEVYRRSGIWVGTFTKFKWLEKEWRLFNWMDEQRLAELEGLYCPKGHLDMRTVEEPVWERKQAAKAETPKNWKCLDCGKPFSGVFAGILVRCFWCGSDKMERYSE